jgi:capsular exopolysaccharide synthesis family protein
VREPELARYPDRPFEAATDDSGLNIKRAISAMWRYKWLVIAVTILGTGAGRMYSRAMKPTYAATTSVWIDQGGSGGALRAPGMFDPEAWQDLVKSFAVWDTVVSNLRLNITINPPVDSKVKSQFFLGESFTPGYYHLRTDSSGKRYTLLKSDDKTVIESGNMGDSVGARLGFRWVPVAGSLPVNEDLTIGVQSIRAAAAGYKERVVVYVDQPGYVVKLSLEDTDPVRLADVLNAASQRFAVVATNLKRQKQVALTRLLAGQAESAKRYLDDAEQAYKAFQIRTITLPDRPMGRAGARGGSEGGYSDAMSTNLFDMQLEARENVQERADIAKILTASPDSELSVTGLERIRTARQSSELTQALSELTQKRAALRALRYTYSEEHPEVVRLRGQVAALEHTTIPAFLRTVDDQLAARATQLQRQTVASADNLREIPPRSIEGAQLLRAMNLAEGLYTSLQARLQEAQIAEASSGVADVRSIDAAVAPSLPTKDTSARLLLMAFLGSLGLGSAGALLLDRADSRFRYPDQVSQELGLTILGAVPHKKGTADGMERTTDDAPLLEALRAIRLNLVYAYGTAGPMVFTVTSPGRSEGKTFLTAQLARVFADSGQRTLVVEGDLRKGVLHRRLSVSRRPGLSDYLRGDTAVDQIVQKTKFAQLHVITGGTRFHDAPELLGTQAMVQLLATLRSRYDVIICDSPPLGAGIDPLVLGTATGNLLLLLRTGVSHRELTEAKLEVISRMPIRLLGAVLNDVPKDVVFSYYSYYLPGYETSDEGKLALPATK